MATASPQTIGDTSANAGDKGKASEGGGGGRGKDEGSSDEEPTIKIPRRTPVACRFCRGRKLKCDGRPVCSNCMRRSLACVYEPVSKH